MTWQKNSGKTNKRPNNEPSASTQFFLEEYVPHINNLVIENFGFSYMTVEETKSNWRKNLETSAELSDFLISETKIFIRLMDAKTHNANNLQFLKSFTVNVADYLAVYFVRLENGAKRNDVRRTLEKMFYDNFQYVQYMLVQQQQKRYAKANNKSKKDNYRKGSNRLESKIPAENGNIESARTQFVRANYAKTGKFNETNVNKK